MKKINNGLFLIAPLVFSASAFAATLNPIDMQSSGSCTAYISLGSQFMAKANKQQLATAYAGFAAQLKQFRDPANPTMFDVGYKRALDANTGALQAATNSRDQNAYERRLSAELDKCADLLVKLKIVK